MPLQVTKEVIRGVTVIRFNGNNSGRSSSRGQTRREIERPLRLAESKKAGATRHKKEKALNRRLM